MLALHLYSLLDVLYLQCGLQMYAFQVVRFRIEHTVSLSRLAKALKLISLCNLHPRTKELCRRLLDSYLLAKTNPIDYMLQASWFPYLCDTEDVGLDLEWFCIRKYLCISSSNDSNPENCPSERDSDIFSKRNSTSKRGPSFARRGAFEEFLFILACPETGSKM